MRQKLTLTLAALMGFSGLAFATSPPEAVQKSAKPAADPSCRNVTTLAGRVQSMCANSAQWAEFDSRMAQLDQGFSCKPVKGAQPLCLFARQWQYVERNKLLRSNTLRNGFGDEAARSAMAINHNEYATVRQDLIDSANGRSLPIP